MLRTVIAIPAGLLSGGVVISFLQLAAMAVFPLPEGTPADRAALAPGDIPALNMVPVLVAWAAGAFVGGGIAARIATQAKRRLALIVGAFFLAAGVFNMVAIPSPPWFWVIGILLFLPSAHLGANILGGEQPTRSR